MILDALQTVWAAVRSWAQSRRSRLALYRCLAEFTAECYNTPIRDTNGPLFEGQDLLACPAAKRPFHLINRPPHPEWRLAQYE